MFIAFSKQLHRMLKLVTLFDGHVRVHVFECGSIIGDVLNASDRQSFDKQAYNLADKR